MGGIEQLYRIPGIHRTDFIYIQTLKSSSLPPLAQNNIYKKLTFITG